MARSFLSIPALAMVAVLALSASPMPGQPFRDTKTLPRTRSLGGEEFLKAFAPISAETRDSIVKLNVDGETVALGTVIATNGLVLTKGSEIKKGKLTCWLASDREVPAELIAVDDQEDVGLVRVHATSLRPIRWAHEPVVIGQWAITPGIASTPQAVGIISALPRRIRPRRAFIGIEFDLNTTRPQLQSTIHGMGAEKAGLKRGDIILSVNGAPVTNRQQVVEKVREFREGDVVRLRLQRGKDQLEAEVRLMSLLAWNFGEQRVNALGTAISQRAQGFDRAIEHDTVLQPWLCGGPLVDLDGKAIGINIARASRVTTYALPASLVQQVAGRLEATMQ